MSEILPYLTALCGVGTFTLALYVALRSNLWREKEGRAGIDAKTGERIERVDATARASIDRVERELSLRIGGQGDRLTRLEERVEHMPTGDDMAAMTKRVGEVEVRLEGVAEVGKSTQEMVRVIRDHLLEREKA